MDPTHPKGDALLVRNATKIAIGIVTLLFLVPIIFFWSQNDANQEARRLVLHTYEVLNRIELLLGKVKEAQLGQRGFLVTGNAEFLEPYESAVRDGGNVDGGQRAVHYHP